MKSFALWLGDTQIVKIQKKIVGNAFFRVEEQQLADYLNRGQGLQHRLDPSR